MATPGSGQEAAPRLWRAIYGFAGGRRHLAEDAVAEAFARAIEHADRIREPLPWIYRTAFRLAARELKREKRGLPLAPDPVPGLDPFEVEEVLGALGALSANQRAAVLLHDEEEHSLEVASTEDQWVLRKVDGHRSRCR